MVKAGDVIVNPVSTDRIVFLRTRSDGNGELLQFDNFHQPNGIGPVPHQHPLQEETFIVKRGAFAITIEGQERVVKAGETVVVPRGAAHTWHIVGTDELHLLTEFRPALHFEEIIETICGLAQAGKMDHKGNPNPLQMTVTLYAYPGEFWLVGPPIFAQKVLYGGLGPVLKHVFGYQPNFPYVPTRP